MSKLFETLLEGVDGALAGNYDLIKSKLTSISKGKINVDYRMRFPKVSKKRF